jgi:hypothetical protein
LASPKIRGCGYAGFRMDIHTLCPNVHHRRSGQLRPGVRFHCFNTTKTPHNKLLLAVITSYTDQRIRAFWTHAPQTCGSTRRRSTSRCPGCRTRRVRSTQALRQRRRNTAPSTGRRSFCPQNTYVRYSFMRSGLHFDDANQPISMAHSRHSHIDSDCAVDAESRRGRRCKSSTTLRVPELRC